MQVGKYQLVRKLAVGGMAEVFLAKAAGPMGFEKTLVLKRILPHLVEDPSFVEMFLAEARLVAGLNHPNVVQIFDFGEAEGSYFLAMEYIDGPNLRRWERRAATQGIRLPHSICAKVISAAAEGLAFAHDFRDPSTGKPLGLIHRDVSPDNILVSRQGAVKVVDFGIAKVANQKHRTQTGIVKGKVAYMPPEQVQGDPLDRRVDVYALGVVLYGLLTGHLPYEASTELEMMQAIISNPPVPVTRYRPDVPKPLQTILATAMAKERANRYPDCRALQEDLDRFVMSTGVPVGAYQIAQLVEQVIDGRVAPPAPLPSPVAPAPAPAQASRRVEAPLDPKRTRASGRRGLRARDTDSTEDQLDPIFDVTTVKSRRAISDPELDAFRIRKRFLPLIAAGAALLVAGGGYLLLGRSKPPPAKAPTEQRAPTESGAVGDVGGAAGAPSADGDTGPGQGTPPDSANRPIGPGSESPTGAAGVGAGSDAQPGSASAPGGTESSNSMAEAGAGTGSGDSAGATGAVSTGDAVPTETSSEHGAAPTDKDGARPLAKGNLGKLEFRIRPYAVVYLDGKKIGQTPFDPIDVPEGIYAVTAVNPKLDKKVTRSVEVKAGESNIFKLNLLEE